MGFMKDSTYKGRTGELKSECYPSKGLGTRPFTRLTALLWSSSRTPHFDCYTQADFDKAYSLLAPIVDIPDYGTYRRGA